MQILAISLPRLFYTHSLSANAIIGMSLVFVSIFLRIYYRHREELKAKIIEADDTDVVKA